MAVLPPNPEQDEGAIEVAPGALADIEGNQEQAEAEESDISDYDGVSSSTSPSASDESAVGEELVGIIPDDISTSLPWFQQGAKVHVLRTDNLQGRHLPWCRESPFHQDPQRVGEGVATLEKEKMCQRCLSRMPRSLYAALAEECG